LENLVAGSGTVFQNQDRDSHFSNKIEKIRMEEELVLSERGFGVDERKDGGKPELLGFLHHI
jgi:hypothetical protein